MSAMDYHYETIGRILSHLINQGLKRIDLEPSDAMEIMTHRKGDEEEVLQTFCDVLHWMQKEGLIRVSSVQMIRDLEVFNGVQLTSKGIAIIQANPDDAELGESIEKKVAEAKPGGLDAAVYTKIGALVGGMMGGFTKAIS